MTDSVLFYYVFGIMSFHIFIAGFLWQYEKRRKPAWSQAFQNMHLMANLMAEFKGRSE